MIVPTRILLITGMSGAGKSTALKTLEDLGWETVDNLPLSLLDRLLATPGGRTSDADARPLAIGIDSRSEEHTSELQSLMRNSYAVFCLKNKNIQSKREKEQTEQLQVKIHISSTLVHIE